MVCLETSFLIDLFRGDTQATELMERIQRSSASITITAMTVAELATGAALAESPREREQLMELIDEVTVLPLDTKEALKAGELTAYLIKSGELIDDFDIAIAAIALSHNESVLTRNRKHFERIPGLVVDEY